MANELLEGNGIQWTGSKYFGYRDKREESQPMLSDNAIDKGKKEKEKLLLGKYTREDLVAMYAVLANETAAQKKLKAEYARLLAESFIKDGKIDEARPYKTYLGETIEEKTAPKYDKNTSLGRIGILLDEIQGHLGRFTSVRLFSIRGNRFLAASTGYVLFSSLVRSLLAFGGLSYGIELVLDFIELGFRVFAPALTTKEENLPRWKVYWERLKEQMTFARVTRMINAAIWVIVNGIGLIFAAPAYILIYGAVNLVGFGLDVAHEVGKTIYNYLQNEKRIAKIEREINEFDKLDKELTTLLSLKPEERTAADSARIAELQATITADKRDQIKALRDVKTILIKENMTSFVHGVRNVIAAVLLVVGMALVFFPPTTIVGAFLIGGGLAFWGGSMLAGWGWRVGRAIIDGVKYCYKWVKDLIPIQKAINKAAKKLTELNEKLKTMDPQLKQQYEKEYRVAHEDHLTHHKTRFEHFKKIIFDTTSVFRPFFGPVIDLAWNAGVAVGGFVGRKLRSWFGNNDQPGVKESKTEIPDSPAITQLLKEKQGEQQKKQGEQFLRGVPSFPNLADVNEVVQQRNSPSPKQRVINVSKSFSDTDNKPTIQIAPESSSSSSSEASSPKTPPKSPTLVVISNSNTSSITSAEHYGNTPHQDSGSYKRNHTGTPPSPGSTPNSKKSRSGTNTPANLSGTLMDDTIPPPPPDESAETTEEVYFSSAPGRISSTPISIPSNKQTFISPDSSVLGTAYSRPSSIPVGGVFPISLPTTKSSGLLSSKNVSSFYAKPSSSLKGFKVQPVVSTSPVP